MDSPLNFGKPRLDRRGASILQNRTHSQACQVGYAPLAFGDAENPQPLILIGRDSKSYDFCFAISNATGLLPKICVIHNSQICSYHAIVGTHRLFLSAKCWKDKDL